MNDYIVKTRFLIAAFCALIMSACNPAMDDMPEKVSVKFNLSIAELRAETRAIGSIDQGVAESSTITDLNVYIWNGYFSYHAYYTSTAGASLDIMTGQYKIVAIANAGKDLGTLEGSVLESATLADLDIDAFNQSIMTYSNEIDINTWTNIPVMLVRTFAYIRYNFAISKAMPDCTLMAYRLFKVPSTTTIKGLNSGVYTNADICVNTTEYYPLSGTSASDETYIYENIQPDNFSITNEKDRIEANAPSSATYMELYCQRTSGAVFTARVYLGEGSAFSVRRNTRTQYNVVVYSENDIRISSTEVLYDPVKTQVVAPEKNGFYDLGTLTYIGVSNEALSNRCMPSFTAGANLATNGGYIQVYKDRQWINCAASEVVTIPSANISDKKAELKYRAYIPESYFLTSSSLSHHVDANYLVTDGQKISMLDAVANTRFGYKATLKSSLQIASVSTLQAENAPTGWVDTVDIEKNVVIETMATNKNATYTIVYPSTLASSFVGIMAPDGSTVGTITAQTTTSVTGKFPVTKTGVYTAKFSSVSVNYTGTLKNSTAIMDRADISIQNPDGKQGDSYSVVYNCASDAGIFIDEYAYNSDSLIYKGSREASTITKKVTLDKNNMASITNVGFVPFKGGQVSYSITVKKGDATIAVKDFTRIIKKTNYYLKLNFTPHDEYPYYIWGGGMYDNVEEWRNILFKVEAQGSGRLDYTAGRLALQIETKFNAYNDISTNPEYDSDERYHGAPNYLVTGHKSTFPVSRTFEFKFDNGDTFSKKIERDIWPLSKVVEDENYRNLSGWSYSSGDNQEGTAPYYNFNNSHPNVDAVLDKFVVTTKKPYELNFVITPSSKRVYR